MSSPGSSCSTVSQHSLIEDQELVLSKKIKITKKKSVDQDAGPSNNAKETKVRK